MKRKVSLLALFVSCMIASAATFFVTTSMKKIEPVKAPIAVADCPMKMDQIRLSSYKYTKPLILANVNNESRTLNNLRFKIEQYIGEAKTSNKVEDVSVYFRKMNDGSTFTINPEEKYNPASMSKIIFLITYLKDAEENSGVLDKKLFFEKHYSEVYNQNIKDFVLKEKTYYSVRDLLVYMIKYSDNDATVLLTKNMNVSIYKKIFSDINVALPPDVGEYYITTYDFSKFLRVLYNATYVRPDLSELGLKILTQSSYREGLLKGIDPGTEVAHKFGERIFGQDAQLHEFGIVYIDGSPYLLGIMTKGKSLTSLSSVIADISRITFAEYRELPQS